jgi:hypothetical protein
MPLALSGRPSPSPTQTTATRTIRQLKEIETKRFEEQQKRFFQARTELALKTGSAKKLLPNQRVHIPPITETLDGDFLTGAENGIAVWKTHFEKTFDRPPPEPRDKPWTETK